MFSLEFFFLTNRMIKEKHKKNIPVTVFLIDLGVSQARHLDSFEGFFTQHSLHSQVLALSVVKAARVENSNGQE